MWSSNKEGENWSSEDKICKTGGEKKNIKTKQIEAVCSFELAWADDFLQVEEAKEGKRKKWKGQRKKPVKCKITYCWTICVSVIKKKRKEGKKKKNNNYVYASKNDMCNWWTVSTLSTFSQIKFSSGGAGGGVTQGSSGLGATVWSPFGPILSVSFLWPASKSEPDKHDANPGSHFSPAWEEGGRSGDATRPPTPPPTCQPCELRQGVDDCISLPQKFTDQRQTGARDICRCRTYVRISSTGAIRLETQVRRALRFSWYDSCYDRVYKR